MHEAPGGGCGFWEWYECDTTTTFLKQLQVDLRDKVWRLSKEIEDLIAATSAARTHVEQMLVQREQSEKKMSAQVLEWGRLLMEKDAQVAALVDRSKKLEKERVVLHSIILACICVVIGMLIK